MLLVVGSKPARTRNQSTSHLTKGHAVNAADVLHQAADIIETRGWAQGKYFTPDGSVCALSAMVEVVQPGTTNIDVTAGDIEKIPAFAEASEALLAMIDGYAIWSWNDNPKTTQQEVVSTLRAAAQKSLA